MVNLELNVAVIGCDRVARSYYGCSGRKIWVFREYIRACYLNSAGNAQVKAGMKVR